MSLTNILADTFLIGSTLAGLSLLVTYGYSAWLILLNVGIAEPLTDIEDDQEDNDEQSTSSENESDE